MSLEYSLSITDTATPAVRELMARMQPERVAARMAPPLALLLRKHIAALPPNRQFPGASTGFNESAARSVGYTADASGVLLSVAKLGFRQRFYGGTIKPTGGKKYLTIPARQEAYGQVARAFGKLRIAYGSGGEPKALVKDVAKNKATFAGSPVLFWLVKSVTQRAHPEIIPSDELFYQAAFMAIVRDSQPSPDNN